ncbi:MAG: hypothetical protein CBE47_01710 [Pelagibacteraceae bacterium TMED287]|nr:MAG: hypothetical protein CBE47_01710 [Pelagibacteraceae bacterium TMED287]|tara:strand:- start:5 stop:307 length:303 start_codon:yes stop_codon:yes gene_type:complete
MEKSKRENLTKKDISNSIGSITGLSSSFISKFLEHTIETIIYGINKYGSLKISNFGTFTKKLKKSRIGRNPKNKQNFEIKERNIITFKAAKYLKDKINNV